MNDTIFLEGVMLSAVIGVYPEERLAKRVLYADVEIVTDMSKAASTDDFTYAVDYSSVVAKLEEIAASTSFFLLEAFAGKCVEEILKMQGVRQVSVKISKPDIFPAVRNTAVKITRSRIG